MSIFTARYITYSIISRNLLNYIKINIRSCLRVEERLKADLESVSRPPHYGNIYKFHNLNHKNKTKISRIKLKFYLISIVAVNKNLLKQNTSKQNTSNTCIYLL